MGIHFQQSGSGPALLLLHGGGMASGAMEIAREHFATRFQVITPDTRGHGKSALGTEPLSYALFARDMVELLDRLGIDKAHVVGFSDGALIGLHIAMEHPTRVTKLVMIGGNYKVDGITEQTRGWFEQMSAETWPRHVAERTPPPPKDTPDPAWDALIPALRTLWLREPNLTKDDLAKVAAPTLVLAGDRDAVTNEHTLEMHAAIPRARLAIIPGTHFVMWERPDRVFAVIDDFLRPAPIKKAKVSSWDVIVAGTGGVGSAALSALAKRKAKVLGIDRFPPGHDRGSSHGDTRVIRLADFEAPDYVPLLKRAYTLWDELSERSNKALIRRTGLVQVGPKSGPVISGVERCAREHNLQVETFDGRALRERFPGFRADDATVVYEKGAGYLQVEACILAQAREATEAGAQLAIGESIENVRATANGVEVTTDRGVHHAAKLVVAPGAWAPRLLGDLGVELTVLRKTMLWFDCAQPQYRAENGCPVFLFDTPQGVFYGIPAINELGLKAAEHSGGERVADPLTVDRSLRRDELSRVERFLDAYLPEARGTFRTHAVCMYTMSPDEKFIVDVHPASKSIVFTCGLSGHGFKFTPVLGEIMADLALDGRTAHNIDFLRLRFGTP